MDLSLNQLLGFIVMEDRGEEDMKNNIIRLIDTQSGHTFARLERLQGFSDGFGVYIQGNRCLIDWTKEGSAITGNVMRRGIALKRGTGFTPGSLTTDTGGTHVESEYNIRAWRSGGR